MQFNNRLILKIIELVSYFETKKKKKKGNSNSKTNKQFICVALLCFLCFALDFLYD